mmetsp:Transcript_23910/g.38127  ORF Transcript_23910/g.38127 Transcript_23910/m.38127 type:complete len:627 (+) Transcript_23910:184-2064(+)
MKRLGVGVGDRVVGVVHNCWLVCRFNFQNYKHKRHLTPQHTNTLTRHRTKLDKTHTLPPVQALHLGVWWPSPPKNNAPQTQEQTCQKSNVIVSSYMVARPTKSNNEAQKDGHRGTKNAGVDEKGAQNTVHHVAKQDGENVKVDANGHGDKPREALVTWEPNEAGGLGRLESGMRSSSGRDQPTSGRPTHCKVNRDTNQSKGCRHPGCTKAAASGTLRLCVAHGGGKRCSHGGCTKGAARGALRLCIAHGGGKRCQETGCSRSARGSTQYCIAHGGGKRCQLEDCPKAAQGASNYCIAHGGGTICAIESCSKTVAASSIHCTKHGGGRKCSMPGCTTISRGSTKFCTAHGGGKRCKVQGCTKSAVGPAVLCKAHGGGKRCKTEGCKNAAAGPLDLCISHGGGKRCTRPECTKPASYRSHLCVMHGGKERCEIEGCFKSATRGLPKLCREHGGKSCMRKNCQNKPVGTSRKCAEHGTIRVCAFSVCKTPSRCGSKYCFKHRDEARRGEVGNVIPVEVDDGRRDKARPDVKYRKFLSGQIGRLESLLHHETKDNPDDSTSPVDHRPSLLNSLDKLIARALGSNSKMKGDSEKIDPDMPSKKRRTKQATSIERPRKATRSSKRLRKTKIL